MTITPAKPVEMTREQFIKQMQNSIAKVFDDLPPVLTIHEINPLFETHDPDNGRIVLNFTVAVLVDKTWEDK